MFCFDQGQWEKPSGFRFAAIVLTCFLIMIIIAISDMKSGWLKNDATASTHSFHVLGVTGDISALLVWRFVHVWSNIKTTRMARRGLAGETCSDGWTRCCRQCKLYGSPERMADPSA